MLFLTLFGNRIPNILHIFNLFTLTFLQNIIKLHSYGNASGNFRYP